MSLRRSCLAAAAVAALLPFAAQGSSHREAPNITRYPTVDSTDFYLFNSYEPGREGYVTLLANYIPLQQPYGGPNYFAMDPAALYEIHVDNDGDAKENLTFQFRFTNRLANDNRGIKLNIGGPAGRGAAQERRRCERGRQLRSQFPRELPGVADARRSSQGNDAASDRRGRRHVFGKPYDFVGTKTFGSVQATGPTRTRSSTR